MSLAIQFDVNSDRVQPASMQTLAALATAMKSPELSKMRFRLEGHTDASGQAAYNRKLSAMRAESVKRVLVINQVAPDRLVTEGKGSSEPLNPADPGAAENRRVRIVSLEP
ncbi:OmpA family protein [Duganella sp. FT92W]|uniref:OmpA family protein n=1 Tax=Pseudoduganella rivuli TaxID=2666085 RepID=A0A7X2LVH8_9BURK|nr:OmpA family protein [Pseudoduganella rivuli]